MVRWVVGSILHGVDSLRYFSFQPVLHDWCNEGSGMCFPVCGMVHIKESLLLIGKSSLCGGSGFPFSLSEWSLTISWPHKTTLYDNKSSNICYEWHVSLVHLDLQPINMLIGRLQPLFLCFSFQVCQWVFITESYLIEYTAFLPLFTAAVTIYMCSKNKITTNVLQIE